MCPEFQKLLPVDPRNPDPAVAEKAAELLARGGVVVLPTETVYGVAADPRVPAAVERIYRIKGRPDSKDIPLLAADIGQVLVAGVVLDARARRLAERFWPGALTLVVQTPGGFKGFRVPDYTVTREILRRVGAVLAVTSANRSGEEPAITAADARRALGDGVDLYVDAGPSPGRVPSTVVKVHEDRVEILREGAIDRKDIERVAAGH